jgi:hypothetical protein
MSKGDPRIGDIIEIPTPRGWAYAQYSHEHPDYGSLIRVLRGTYERRPDDLHQVATAAERFAVFFPLRAAVRQGIVLIVGNEEVPRERQSFPTFKSGIPDPSTGRVETWWLWDGEREWSVEQLREHELAYPIREIVNDTLLVERILDDWSPVQEARA